MQVFMLSITPLIFSSEPRARQGLRNFVKGESSDAADTLQNLLNKAIYAGNKSEILRLIKSGAQVNKCGTPFSSSSLETAIRMNNIEVAELLIDQGASVDSPYLLGTAFRFLSDSIKKGNFDMIRLLIARGANLTVQHKVKNITMGSRIVTPLSEAVELGNVALVEFLLEKGAVIYSSILHSVSKKCTAELGQFLIKKGADIHSRSNTQGTPLHSAAFDANHDLVEVLVGAGADVQAQDRNNMTALQIACSGANKKTVALLLEKSKNVEILDQFNRNLLHIACHVGPKYHHSGRTDDTSEVVDYLLASGWKVDIRDKGQNTPLHLASSAGNEKVVLLLLKHGADINACDEEGRSPLLNGCEAGNEKIVTVLLENGADSRLCDKKGKTALHYASKDDRSGYWDSTDQKRKIILTLIEAGLDVNAEDTDGTSALHYACSSNDIKRVELLIERGAKVRCQNRRKWTPLHEACSHTREEIIDLLVKHGADLSVRCQGSFGEMRGSPLDILEQVVRRNRGMCGAASNSSRKYERSAQDVLESLRQKYAQQQEVAVEIVDDEIRNQENNNVAQDPQEAYFAAIRAGNILLIGEILDRVANNEEYH